MTGTTITPQMTWAECEDLSDEEIRTMHQSETELIEGEKYQAWRTSQESRGAKFSRPKTLDEFLSFYHEPIGVEACRILSRDTLSRSTGDALPAQTVAASERLTFMQIGKETKLVSETQVREAQTALLEGTLDEKSTKLIDALLSRFILAKTKPLHWEACGATK